MEFVALDSVKKEYQAGEGHVRALEEISLTIDEGEFVAIMGPSGSGKTTLLNILGAMSPPTTGKLLVEGIDIYGLKQEKRADFRHEFLGFIFQQLHLIPYLTAIENVMLPLVISQMNGSKASVARDALVKVGLGDKVDRLPDQLSGGEQGRVAIARAIVNEPPILLADEPTGTLDSRTGEEIMEIFQTLNQEGHTIIMVTHSAESAGHATRVISIADGRIVDDRLQSQSSVVREEV